MSSLQARLNDSEYKNWVKAGLCLMYTKDGLEDFVDNTTQQLHQNVIGNLTRQLGAHTRQAVCGVTFHKQQLVITCNDLYCQTFLNAVMQEGLDPTHPFTLKHGNLGNSNTSLWHSHPYELSKLFMNPGQQPTHSGPAETDLSGLVNFIAHCRVPSSQITSRRLLDEVRTARNAIMHTSTFKVTDPDLKLYSKAMTSLLSDVNIAASTRAQDGVTQIQDVKKADFIITKDDEENALIALKDEIHRMYELARDEMSKLDDRVDTLSEDVSVLKHHELRVLKDDVMKNDTDISKVKQSVEAMRTLIEHSEDMHGTTQHLVKELLEQTKSITERNTTLHLKVEDIQRTIIAMQEQIDENQRQIVRLSEEQNKQKEKQTEYRQEIKQDISIIYRLQDDLSEEQTMLKERQTKLKEKQTEYRQEIKQDISIIYRRQDDLSEEQTMLKERQTKLKEKQAEDRQETDFLRQRQEHLSKAVEEIRNKSEPHIPAEKDKAGLRQYLKEGYKDKLYITLLPDWEPLHVSEIFTPSILVADQGKKEQPDEKFKSLGSYREIFYNKDILQKRVVLIGEAGCGKSTFCKHITEIWRGSTSAPTSQFTDTSVLKQINYLFYVSCRFAKKEDTILNMIENQLFSDDSKLSVARYVLKHHPDLCLIIVDGADEFEGTSATGRRDDIVGLPGLEGVEDCVILITSRPWKFHSLSKQAREKFWRLKIDGIQNVNELSQQILLKLEDPTPEQSADEFLRQVRNRNMSDLMKIPLILIIAIRGWVGDNDDETVRSLHKSVCINYINMIQSLIRRSEGQAGWSNSESKLRQLVPNFENLQIKWGQTSYELPPVVLQYKDVQRYAGLLLSVGHLAFDLLLGAEEQSLVFSKAKVKKYLPAGDENDDSIKACLALGIISKTETTPRGLKKLESYAFCHKTFQEFFAALWLASKYQTEKNKLYQCIKTVEDLLGFEMLIQFVCGFDPAIGKQMWLYLSEEVEMKVEAGQVQKLMWLLLSAEAEGQYPWEQVQKLACRCMKEHDVDLKDQMSSQVYFCIPHIVIYKYTSDEDIELLCHVMEEYYSNVKSVEVCMYDRESQQQVQNICKSISYCSGLRDVILLGFPAVSSVLDLQKLNKLEKLWLSSISVESLLLPGEGATITTLILEHVTMTHHSLKQLEKLSSYTNLKTLRVERVSCSDNDSVCIPVLDLRQHNKLEALWLSIISVESLLLPVERATITTLELVKVTMTHHGLEQLLDTLPRLTRPQYMNLCYIRCHEHGRDSSCKPLQNIYKIYKRWQQQHYLPAE